MKLYRGWKIVKMDRKRVEEGVAKMRKALVEDAIKRQNRARTFPEDWRGRIVGLSS